MAPTFTPKRCETRGLKGAHVLEPSKPVAKKKRGEEREENRKRKREKRKERKYIDCQKQGGINHTRAHHTRHSALTSLHLCDLASLPPPATPTSILPRLKDYVPLRHESLIIHQLYHSFLKAGASFLKDYVPLPPHSLLSYPRPGQRPRDASKLTGKAVRGEGTK